MGEGDKSEVLEAVVEEAADLDNIPIKEVFHNLRCSREGLTTEAAQERLSIFGHNKLKEKRESEFLWFMWNPLSCVMEAAAAMAIALANGGAVSKTNPKGYVNLFWKQLDHLRNAGFDPTLFRVDLYGNVLYLLADSASPLAWDIDHWFPCLRGGK